MRKNPRFHLLDYRIWMILSIIMFAVAIAFYAYLGIFSRLQADDYCYGSVVRRIGFWPAQVHLYQTSSNRYTSSFIISLVDRMGVRAGEFLAAFVILLLVTGLTWLIYRLLRSIRLPNSFWIAILIAEIISFFVILETPQRYQVFYWRSATVVYSLSLAGLILLSAILLNRYSKVSKPRWYEYPAFSLAAFLVGGFSETILVLAIGLLGLGFVGTCFWAEMRKPKYWRLLVAILVGLIVSLIVVYFSPANALRQEHYSHTANIGELLWMSFYNAFVFMHDSIQAYGFRLIIALIIPMLSLYAVTNRLENPSRIKPTHLVLTMLLAPLVAFLLTVCVCAPSVYAASSYPESRVLIYATFILITLTAFEGSLLGVMLGQLHVYAKQPVPGGLLALNLLLFLSLSLYPIYDVSRILAEIPVYQAWAETWDQRDRQIRSQIDGGISEIDVTAHDSIHLILELGPDPNLWVNRCAARYYGVDSITAQLP